MRRAVDWAGTSGVFELILDRLERVGSWPRGTLAVLTYHRVDDPRARPDLFPGLVSATPAEFERQVAHLARRMRVVSAEDLLAARRRTAVLPLRAVHITVDDAYRDFAEQAWPVLRRYGLPVTLFVPTAYPDQPGRAFWWDRLYSACMATDHRSLDLEGIGHVDLGEEPAERLSAMISLRDRLKALEHDAAMTVVDRIEAALEAAPAEPAVLSWGDLRDLAKEGVALAPHSRTHPLLNRLAPERLGDELAGSRADLERETGSRQPLFAYPSGAYDERAVDAVRGAGFEIAFTTNRGTWDTLEGDWLRVNRINVGGRSSLSVVRAQMVPAAVRLGRITSNMT